MLSTRRDSCIAPKNKLDPVTMEKVGSIPRKLGGLIFGALKGMLEIDYRRRDSVSSLLDKWNGVFEVAVQKAHVLHGKAL